MEKLFTPGKWFVAFCAIFVVVFVVRNYVRMSRIEAESKSYGETVFDWRYEPGRLKSTCEMLDAKVLKSDDNSATVEVSGKQHLSDLDKAGPDKTVECKAVVYIYRQDNHWQLGSIEVR